MIVPSLLAESLPAAGSTTTTIAMWLCPIVGHFLGAVPVGLLLGFAKGVDIRQHGSGNIGATNAARVLGWKWGILALVLDALKGLLPVLAARVLTSDSPNSIHIQVATGIFAILGHMFPIWLGFRGGKGVATGLGVALVLSPISSLFALAAYLIMFAVTRVSSMGSLVAALTFPTAEWIRTGSNMFSREHWSLGLFSLAIPALIILRHRSNIVRMIRGQEGALKAPAAEPPAAEPPKQDG